MLSVARCESGARQLDGNGEVIENKTTHDYGIFQISYQHIPKAKELGYDVMTLEGNIKMAKYILQSQHLNAWSASYGCWNKGWLAKT